MLDPVKENLSENFKELDAHSRPLGDFLFSKDQFYSIPGNQRKYRWKEKQIIDMISDIMNWHGFSDKHPEGYEDIKERPYFMGAIHLVTTKTPSNYGVIDGQQRLITSYLIIAALYHILKLRHPEYSHNTLHNCLVTYGQNENSFNEIVKCRIDVGYLRKTKDDQTILGLIAQERPIEFKEEIECENPRLFKDEKEPINTIIQNLAKNDIQSKNILKAYNIIEKYIIKNDYLLNHNAIKRIQTAVLGIRFIRIESTSTSAALFAFETMNNRGLDLSPIEMFKNYLFMLINPNCHKEFELKWEEIESEIESIPSEKNNEKKMEKFFRHLVLGKYNETPENYIARDDVYASLRNKIIQENAKYKVDMDTFINDVISESKRYKNYLNACNIDGSENIYLKNIKNLNSQIDQYIPLLIAGSHFEQELFDYLCSEIEKILLTFAISSTTIEKARYTFLKLTILLRTIKSNDLKTLKETLDIWFGGEKARKFEDFQEGTRTIGEKINIEKINNEQNVKNKTNSTSYKQYYAIKCLIAKISNENEKLYGNTNNDSISEYITPLWEIEHISPKNQNNLAEKIEKKYINYIGNMTLLTKSENASGGNNPYKDKISIYKTSHFIINKCLVENLTRKGESKAAKAVCNLPHYEEWTTKEIIDRQNWIEEQAMNILGIRQRKEHGTLFENKLDNKSTT